MGIFAFGAAALLFGTIDVSGLSVEDLRRFHHRLRQGWVRMDRQSYIGGQRAHFDGEHSFRDEFACARADDADTEHALCLGIDEKFGKTFGAIEGDGASGSGPGELGDGDFAALFFGLGFGQAGPRDFGVGKYNRGNRVRLESNFMPGDGFDRGAALVHSLVGKHRFAGNIADGVDGRLGGLSLLVDFNESLLIDFDFGSVEAGDLGIWAASYGHQDAVEELLFFFYVWSVKGHADAGLLVLQRFDRRVQEDRGEQFLQALVQRQDQIAIGSGQQAGHHFYAGHFGAERGVDGSKFQSNVAAADHEQRFRDVGQVERAGRIHEARAVELEAGHDGWTRSGGNDDAVEGQALFSAGCRLRNFQRCRIRERRFALDELDRPLFG